MLRQSCSLLSRAGGLARAAPAGAAPSGYPTPREIAAPPQAGVIVLGPASANPNPEQWEGMGADIKARNVSQATLQPILPAPGHGNGAAVLVDVWIDQFYAWLGALGLLKH